MRPEATTELGPCGVRSGTDHPCPRPAAVRICGVPFCQRCAREQEAYFAVGELTKALAADRRNRPLDLRRAEPVVAMLDRTRWELTRRLVKAGGSGRRWRRQAPLLPPAPPVGGLPAGARAADRLRADGLARRVSVEERKRLGPHTIGGTKRCWV